MSIVASLASSLGRRDELPNQELAKQIAAKKDRAAVRELIDQLSNKSRDIQSDCIKVLYETGSLAPTLLADYAAVFTTLLSHKNNRLQWGAMKALDSIALENPQAIYASLPTIVEAADKGSVITTDGAVQILIKLCSIPFYADNAFDLLLEQLVKSPTNQLPMYAERALPVINATNKTRFVQILTSRQGEFEKESQSKRVQKVIVLCGKK